MKFHIIFSREARYQERNVEEFNAKDISAKPEKVRRRRAAELVEERRRLTLEEPTLDDLVAEVAAD